MKNGWNTVRMCVLSVIFLCCFAGKMPESGMFKGLSGKENEVSVLHVQMYFFVTEKNSGNYEKTGGKMEDIVLYGVFLDELCCAYLQLLFWGSPDLFCCFDYV